jgi:hypothetical protein
VPEAAVIHEQPLTGPEVKKPWPLLKRKLLFTNQLADGEILLNELTPLELNSPCAKNWKSAVLRGISADVACVHAAPVDGAWAQTRTAMMVIGVDVAIGAELLEPPPQLSNSVIITKAKNGATTKHLFCHIKHPAMPWQLLRCQEASRENQTNLITPGLENRRHATQKKRQADFENKVDAVGRTKERRASREGGGSPMPACSWSALRRTPFRLPGGVSNRSAAAMTANKSAPERFDDDPAGLFRCIADRIFTKAGGLTKSSFEKLFEPKERRP